MFVWQAVLTSHKLQNCFVSPFKMNGMHMYLWEYAAVIPFQISERKCNQYFAWALVCMMMAAWLLIVASDNSLAVHGAARMLSGSLWLVMTLSTTLPRYMGPRFWWCSAHFAPWVAYTVGYSLFYGCVLLCNLTPVYPHLQYHSCFCWITPNIKTCAGQQRPWLCDQPFAVCVKLRMHSFGENMESALTEYCFTG